MACLSLYRSQAHVFIQQTVVEYLPCAMYSEVGKGLQKWKETCQNGEQRTRTVHHAGPMERIPFFTQCNEKSMKRALSREVPQTD